MKLIDVGQEMAKDFVQSGQDIFIMVAEIGGKDVTVTVRYAPVAKRFDYRKGDRLDFVMDGMVRDVAHKTLIKV